MPTPAELAANLNGAPDLYAALGQSGATPDDLTALIAACDAATQTRLRSLNPGFLAAILRHAQTGHAIPTAPALRAALARLPTAPMFDPAIADGPSVALLTAGQRPDMPAFSDRAFDAWFVAQGVPYGLGAYGEDRRVYTSAQFADAGGPERRTVHTGIDVFAPAMTPVHAPIAGRVLHVTYNADPLDYGHTLILQHTVEGLPCFTLYGHLSATLPTLLAPGDSVEPGQLIAHFGDWHENGGWAPHLHFQVMSDMIGRTDGNFVGAGHAALWDVWRDICLDPNLVLRLPPARFSVG
ncbi:MAG: peptidoglycan DD-metalloendopeptidase family protein [Paracoccaceae bacterium]